MRHHSVPSFVAIFGVILLVGCGGGSSGPTPVPTPVPTPTPAPEPTPTPSPTPTPCTEGLCEDPTSNTAPVVRVTLRLYQLFDEQGNWILPTPNPVAQVVKEPIPVGYVIRLDVVGKDASNKDTLGKKGIEFRYSDESTISEYVQSDFQRKIKVLKPGSFTVYAVFDGVGSNDLQFTFIVK